MSCGLENEARGGRSQNRRVPRKNASLVSSCYKNEFHKQRPGKKKEKGKILAPMSQCRPRKLLSRGNKTGLDFRMEDEWKANRSMSDMIRGLGLAGLYGAHHHVRRRRSK